MPRLLETGSIDFRNSISISGNADSLNRVNMCFLPRLGTYHSLDIRKEMGLFYLSLLFHLLFHSGVENYLKCVLQLKATDALQLQFSRNPNRLDTQVKRRAFCEQKSCRVEESNK